MLLNISCKHDKICPKQIVHNDINIFRDRELAMAKQKATQAYIAEFKNAREEWKVRERQRMEEENTILQCSLGLSPPVLSPKFSFLPVSPH
jgi:biopolymer transport protein ExbB/TolQ